MTEETYHAVRDYAFNLANFMIRNYDDAEDIAQIVSLKFLLNEDKIIKPLAWSATVIKNEVYKRAKKTKGLEKLLEKTELEKIEEKLDDACSVDKYSEKYISISDAKTLLKRSDYRIFKLWLNADFNVKKVANKLKLSYNATRSKVYKMKKNLRAEKLKQQGWLGSKDIIDYNTNKNIITFINTFVKKMEKRDFDHLRSYFEYIEIEKITKLDIKQIFNYDILLLKRNLYELYIPYEDSKSKVQFCIFRFKLDKQNHIKITKFFAKPTKVVKINMPKKEALKMLPRMEKGVLPISAEEVIKILKKKDP
ncbi:MAG: sigma-70 family RNA polymerase sigma factor [Armatimonadetes bacterium]|nr:sigma-70 family RNA polymerase sigma factor [Armatimonadota bacterium]